MNKFFSLVCALSLSIFLFVLPASAVDVSWDTALVPNATFSSSVALRVFGSTDSSNVYKFTANADDVYVAVVVSNNELNSFVACSLNSGRVYESTSSYYALNNTYSDTDTGLQIKWGGSYLGWRNYYVFPGIPVFSSREELLSSFASFLASPSASGYPCTFVVPPGYFATFHASETNLNNVDRSVFKLSATFPFNSSLGSSDPWGETGMSYTYGSTEFVPDSSTVLPLSGMSFVNWTRALNVNALGQTRSGVATMSFSGSSTWVTLWNPFYSFDSSYDNLKYNPTIYVQGCFDSIKLYPVSQSLTSNGWHATSIDDYSYPYIGVVPENGSGGQLDSGYPSVTWTRSQPTEDPEDPGTIVPSDPAPVPAPSPGGSNEVTEEDTSGTFLQSIIDLLGNLVSGIAGIFTFAFEAIVNLSSLAGSFFAVLGGLFAWLPSDVATLLVSSLALIVTVGVLKSFL